MRSSTSCAMRSPASTARKTPPYTATIASTEGTNGYKIESAGQWTVHAHAQERNAVQYKISHQDHTEANGTTQQE